MKLSLRKHKIDNELINFRRKTYSLLYEVQQDDSSQILRDFFEIREDNLKSEFLVNYFTTNLNFDNVNIDPNSFFTFNPSYQTADEVKCLLNELKKLTDKLDENEEEVESHGIRFPDLFLKNIIYEMLLTSDIQTKQIISFIIASFARNSELVTQQFLRNPEFINILFKLTYYNDILFVDNIFNIFACIVYDFKHETIKLLQAYPFHTRIIEILAASGVSITLEKEFELNFLVNYDTIIENVTGDEQVQFLEVSLYFIYFILELF